MEITALTRLSLALPHCFHTDIGICHSCPGHSCKSWLELVQSDEYHMDAPCVGVLTVKTAPHAQSCSGLCAPDTSSRHMFDERVTNTKKS